MKVNVEMTDLFCGETNYSFVKRKEFTFDDNITDNSLIRKIKKAYDWNGVRCVKTDYGDLITLKPYGAHLILIINFW